MERAVGALAVLLAVSAAGCGRAPWRSPAAGMAAQTGSSGGGCWSCERDGRMVVGGTQSLFLGETGYGQFNRSVEDTTGERIRNGLTGADKLAGDILEREAVELSLLHGAAPGRRLAVAVASLKGAKGEFLGAAIRRYAFVLQESALHPVSDPCTYAGPLIPEGRDNYDPRELCWWQGTFQLLGLPER